MRIVLEDGTERFCGLTPTPEHLKAAFPLWSAANDVLPESQWVEFEEVWPDAIKIKDQNGVGACNGHATALSAELARYVEGYPHVPLSAWWVYGNLATWPVDSGSSIGDGLTLMEKSGCAPESDVPYKMWRRSAFSTEAKADAPRFKVARGQAIDSDEAFASAVQRRQPINFAIPAGSRLGNLDADGVSPLAMGFCNHAVTAWGGMKKTRTHGWVFQWINSWTPQWGRQGKAWLPVSGITRHPGFEAYVVLAPSSDPQDGHPLPTPKG